MLRQKLIRSSAAILAIAALIFTGCAPAQTNNTGEDMTTTTTGNGDETVKIGYIGPLTGDLASIGADEKRAIELALAQRGAENVEVIYEDAHCDGQAAANAAQKLINIDNVKVIMGAGCSGGSLAAAPIANENNVLLFSSLSTSPELSDVGGDYFFRNAPSDALASTVMAELLAGKQVALISENTDFSQAYRSQLTTKIAEQGGEIVVDETFNPDTTDFKTILQKVQESGAEAIANLANSAVSAGIISRQAAELGLDVEMYGTDAFSGAEYLENAGEAAEGATVVMVAANTADPRVNDLFAKYESEYGEAPASGAYTALAYDRMNILLNAVEQVGYDADAIRGYLMTINYDGLSGQTSFDESGDSSIRPLVLRYESGELVPVQ